jgi:hypothetical protein
MPTSRRPVTLQIGLTPADLPDVRLLLPHQLRTWGAQVHEILCLVDVPPMPADTRPPRLEELSDFFDSQRRSYPHLTWRLVDYSPEAVRRVEQEFYGGRPIPIRDYRNRPIYTYLYLLLAPTHDLVLHLDCDMMFGGASQTWVAEAVEHLTQRPDVVACKPYPGPPRPDGRPLSQRSPPVQELEMPFAYRFSTFTYRVFLLDRRMFAERLAPLRNEWPPWPSALRALLRRRRPYALLEQVIGTAMRRHGQWRLDFLGSAPGMWTLHPRYRTARYRSVLPELLRMVEAGNVPDEQRGYYDITDETFRYAEEASPSPPAEIGT